MSEDHENAIKAALITLISYEKKKSEVELLRKEVEILKANLDFANKTIGSLERLIAEFLQKKVKENGSL